MSGGPREEAAKVEGQAREDAVMRGYECGRRNALIKAAEIADSVWLPDKSGKVVGDAIRALLAPSSSPEPPASARKAAARKAAEAVVAAWEAEEGESMRDGHRETLVRLIAKSLRAALESERGADR